MQEHLVQPSFADLNALLLLWRQLSLLAGQDAAVVEFTAFRSGVSKDAPGESSVNAEGIVREVFPDGPRVDSPSNKLFRAEVW